MCETCITGDVDRLGYYSSLSCGQYRVYEDGLWEDGRLLGVWGVLDPLLAPNNAGGPSHSPHISHFGVNGRCPAIYRTIGEWAIYCDISDYRGTIGVAGVEGDNKGRDPPGV